MNLNFDHKGRNKINDWSICEHFFGFIKNWQKTKFILPWKIFNWLLFSIYRCIGFYKIWLSFGLVKFLLGVGESSLSSRKPTRNSCKKLILINIYKQSQPILIMSLSLTNIFNRVQTNWQMPKTWCKLTKKQQVQRRWKWKWRRWWAY